MKKPKQTRFWSSLKASLRQQIFGDLVSPSDPSAQHHVDYAASQLDELVATLQRNATAIGTRLRHSVASPQEKAAREARRLARKSWEMLLGPLRRKLGVPIGTALTAKTIKKAYKAKAREVHPDLNTESPDANTQMAELTKARDDLLSYVRGEPAPRDPWVEARMREFRDAVWNASS